MSLTRLQTKRKPRHQKKGMATRDRMLIAPDGAAGSTTIEAVSALKLWPEDGMTMSSESPLCWRPSTRSTVRPSTDALRATSEATKVSRAMERKLGRVSGEREGHDESSQPPKVQRRAEKTRQPPPVPTPKPPQDPDHQQKACFLGGRGSLTEPRHGR